MDIEQIKFEYNDKLESYDNLGSSLIETIKILLKEKEIKVLSITYRIKKLNSFIEKIDRKTYDNPLEEIEDICGIRIICYYVKDIVQINKILTEELDIYESTDKESKLKYDQFGYRSHHLIASIKKEWEKVPLYRNLSKLKCEIQIRTVLMHAWAEIEHSLAYKSEAQTPTQFRRKIHRISAKLEEADEQFEELKKESEEYQSGLVSVITNPNESIELNLDTIQAYMDHNFPNRRKDVESAGRLIDQMNEYNISLSDLSKAWNKVKPNFEKIEREYWEDKPTFNKWIQVGIARFTLDLVFEDFNKRLKSGIRRKEREKFRKKYLS